MWVRAEGGWTRRSLQLLVFPREVATCVSTTPAEQRLPLHDSTIVGSTLEAAMDGMDGDSTKLLSIERGGHLYGWGGSWGHGQLYTTTLCGRGSSYTATARVTAAPRSRLREGMFPVKW